MISDTYSSSLNQLAGFGLFLLSKINFTNFLLFYTFICGIFFYPTLQDTIPTVGTIIFYLRYLFAFLLLLGLLLHIIIFKNFHLYFDQYVIISVLYLISALISILNNFSHSYNKIAFNEIQYTMFSFLVYIVFIQTLQSKHIARIMKVLILYAVINVIVSFIQLKLNWQDRTVSNISSLFADRNMFTRFLVTVNSYLLIKTFSQGNNGFLNNKKAMIMLMTLIFICITLMYSRGGYVLYIIATTIIIWHTKNKHIQRMSTILGIFVIILFSIMIYQRIKKDYMNIKNNSDLSRMSAFQAGINMIKDKPLTGVGYGMSKQKFTKYENKSFPGTVAMTTIHNIYITIFAEQGIFGLLLYLLFNFGLLIALFKKISQANGISDIQNELFCFTSLFLYMIHGIVYHTFDSEGYYWIIIALCIITLKEYNQKDLGRF